MEDIEDLFKNEADQLEKRTDKRRVIKSTRPKNKKLNNEDNQESNDTNQNNNTAENTAKEKSVVPGKERVFVKTYGCSHNISDSEYMAGLLAEYGYQITDSIDNADACLLNSCTVKNPSQEKFVNLVAKAQKEKKPVIVSGCVPQGDRNLKGLEEVSIIGVSQIDRVVEVVEEALKGHTVRLLAKKELPILDLPKIRKNSLVEIIPLSTGCLGSCTYCKTRHARGKLGSYDPQAIVDRAQQAIDEGVMEIWLTSEDTGAYGRDINTNLPDLLKAIIKIMPDHTMLRLGMTNPPYILEHLQAMADIMNHPRVYQFLHVPVQSGSNDVLDRMNREYTVEEFNEVCDFLKENVPHMTLATDIICGFPTEEHDHHVETCDLVKRHQFPVLNISQFYSRPGTVAAKWKKVPSAEIKKRSSEVTTIFNSYMTNHHFVGTEQLVWVMGFDDRVKKAADKSTEKPQLMGHTKTYTKVVIPQTSEVIGDQPAESLVGKCVKMKIVEAQKWHITGYIIDFAPVPEKAPVDYFEKCEDRRKQQLIEQFQEQQARQEKEEVEQLKMANGGSTENTTKLVKLGAFETAEEKKERDMHFFAMILVAFGVYLLLKSLSAF